MRKNKHRPLNHKRSYNEDKTLSPRRPHGLRRGVEGLTPKQQEAMERRIEAGVYDHAAARRRRFSEG